MNRFVESVKRFLVDDDGPTAIEYAVMAVSILVVCIVTIETIGTATATMFEEIKNSLP